MKKMLKVLVLTLALTLGLGCFAACGSSGSTSTTVAYSGVMREFENTDGSGATFYNTTSGKINLYDDNTYEYWSTRTELYVQSSTNVLFCVQIIIEQTGTYTLDASSDEYETVAVLSAPTRSIYTQQQPFVDDCWNMCAEYAGSSSTFEATGTILDTAVLSESDLALLDLIINDSTFEYFKYALKGATTITIDNETEYFTFS